MTEQGQLARSDGELRRNSGDEASAAITLSFVIPALNEEMLLDRCLGSIGELELPSFVRDVQVLVVDNESQDATAQVAESLGATVVRSPPGSAARARNLGAAASNGDWLAMVDADCELSPDWLLQSAELLLRNDVVAVGSQISPPTSLESWVANAAQLLEAAKADVRVVHAPWLPTAGLLVKRSAFDEIGGFDESLITCEDCDLGFRLSAHGRLLKCRDAVLIHHGESSTLGDLFFREAWRARGNLRLALSRPLDLGNWTSIVAPMSFLFGFAAGAAGLSWSFVSRTAPTPWILLLGAALSLPPLYCIAKRRRIPRPLQLVQLSTYVAVYFAGRAVGTLRPFRRRERLKTT